MKKFTGFKTLLSEQEIKQLKPPEEQFANLGDALMDNILGPMGTLTAAQAKRLADKLYSVADAAFYLENMVAWDRKAERPLRDSAKPFRKSLVRIGRSLEALNEAETALQPARLGLKKGMFDFGAVRVPLLALKEKLARMENIIAALIQPDLRKPKEKVGATGAPFRVEPSGLPINKGSAELHRLVTMVLYKWLKGFAKGKVPDSKIDEFIAAFFKAIGYGMMTAANVKTMRYRWTQRTQESVKSPRGRKQRRQMKK